MLGRMQILVMTGMTLPEISEADLAKIREAGGPETVIRVAHTPAEARAAAPETEVLLGWIDPELLAAMPRLRWVHGTASGVDQFVFPAFVEHAAILTGEKGLVGPHLADHAFALLLGLTRRVAAAAQAGPASWEARLDYRRVAIELDGLTMGIVGFGGTGREVARRAQGFGMEVLAVDRDVVANTPNVPLVRQMNWLPRLLEQSDVVTICAPLTDETRGLFNADVFAQMQPGAILVNVTRGEIVDGEALLAALQSGRLGGACLDVFPEEPLPPAHPFWTMENVVMTPHTAGASQRRAARNLERFVGNVRRFRRGQPLIGSVDKAAGY